MKNKLIARIKGGLGNQLFCHAAACRLALANDAELVIDDVTGFVRDHTFTNVGTRSITFPSPAGKRLLGSAWNPWSAGDVLFRSGSPVGNRSKGVFILNSKYFGT